MGRQQQQPNPFKPGFGNSPPVLAGRQQYLDDFTEALADGPGAFGRILLLSGQRGCGKTVMLNALEDEAQLAGWLVISETTTRGLVERLTTDHLPRLLRDHDPRQTESDVTTVTLPGGLGGAGRNVRARHNPVPSLRSQLTDLIDIQAARGNGVLLTIDEMHRGARTDPASRSTAAVLDDLEQITATLQHLVRERREVAFAGAGLNVNLNKLLKLPNMTFFRRAERIDLDGIADSQTAVALREPILNGGRTIGPAALQAAVEGAEGYPFLVQLVGMQSWRVDRDSTEITLEHVREGIDRAHERMGALVHEIALQEVPEAQRAYLAAMAVDDGPSSTGEIARRLDINAQHANVFRDRLIKDAELITSDGRGLVDFALPYLREYMREQPAFEPFADQLPRIDEREAPGESRLDRSVSQGRRTIPRRAGDRSGPDHDRG
jgi:hypothetical protein